MKRVLLAWSSGKDSAWALHVLRHQAAVEVVALLTTFNEAFDRVAMHAVRRELVERQASAAGLPLWPVMLPWPCANEMYEARMAEACERASREGVNAVAFGDLFLEDVRQYRERQLAPTGLEPLFPLWGEPTSDLVHRMICAGQKTRITCVDPRKLSRDFCGRDLDANLLAELPDGVDPCGENGEFHSFVYESPVFDAPIAIRSGDTVERDGFVFADVLPL